MNDNERTGNSGNALLDMRNYDKFSDRLDSKILDFNLKVLGVISAVMLRPLALCTQIIFRNHFGERYFNVTMLILATLLYFAAGFFANVAAEAGHLLLQTTDRWSGLGVWLADHYKPKVIDSVIAAIFYIRASANLNAIRNRQKQGVPWYSMSRGQSIFGSESQKREVLFSILIGGVLLLLSPAFGILFFASRCAAAYLFIKEQQSNYARYLDYMDAQILAGKLEPAMIGNRTIDETKGLYCPLPKRITGEHRARVAKISAGVIARSSAARAASEDQYSRVASSIPDAPYRPSEPGKSPATPTNGPRREPGEETSKAVFIAPRNTNFQQTSPQPTHPQKSKQVVPMKLHNASLGVMTEFVADGKNYRLSIQVLINNYVIKGAKVTLMKPDLGLVVHSGDKYDSVKLQEIVDHFAATRQQA
jgi:hypothetical protein